MSEPIRLVVKNTGPGDCRDPDHRGLRRLLVEWPSVDADTSWMGADVETLHLVTARLIRENKELMRGGARQYSDGVLFAVGLAAATFAVGLFVGALVFGIGGWR